MYTYLLSSTLEMPPRREEKKGEFGREQLSRDSVPIKKSPVGS